ncbi:MAG: hypothetical protein ACFB0D_10180 [Phormidesmis sp.]
MGILEFVFGKSAPKDDTAPKQAYYLSDDDAKSFGNIDYMRSTKVVKRTFAKQKGKEHMESVRSISATKMTDLDGNVSSAPVSAPTTFGNTDFLGDKKSEPAKTESTPSESVPKAERPKRAPSSNDMDMFRNMAKDIRK